MLLKSPLLKLAVVNVDAPPTDTKPAAATEVTSVEPIIVEVPEAVAFIGVSNSDVPDAVSLFKISIEELPVPIDNACLSVADVPDASTCESSVITDIPL